MIYTFNAMMKSRDNKIIKEKMRNIAICVCLLFLKNAALASETLKVGVIEIPPFVIKQGKIYTGIAVDLWNEIAARLKVKSEFIDLPSTDTKKAFDALERREVDVLVAPLSVEPSRYKKADFTFPFFLDKVVLVSHKGYFHNLVVFIKTFVFSIGAVLFALFLLYVIYIHLFWFFERLRSKKIPDAYIKGISNLFWTHVLIGQHEQIPRSLGGKMAILIQKTATFVILIFLNAGIISFLTAFVVKYEGPVQKLSDLENVQVGAIKDSKPYEVAINAGLRVVPFESLKEGVEALDQGKIKSFVVDFSEIESYMSENAIVNLDVSDFNLRWDLYSFATPIGSSLTRKVNDIILDLRDDGIPQRIARSYLPQAVTSSEF